MSLLWLTNKPFLDRFSYNHYIYKRQKPAMPVLSTDRSRAKRKMVLPHRARRVKNAEALLKICLQDIKQARSHENGNEDERSR